MCSHDHDPAGPSWRSAITTAAAAVAGAAPGSTGSRAAATPAAYADPPSPALPTSTMALVPGRVALRVVDPQNNFLTERGVARGVVAESVREHNVVNNTERLFRAAKAADLTVAISPHFYDPTDHGWRFEGTLERVMHSIGMVDRVGPLDLTGFAGSGADFVERYKPFIHDGKTIIASPHKIDGPETNDLALQLRKQRVDRVILAGMASNLCVESHMRQLMERGFEVAVVRDAIAGAKVSKGDGYLASLINFWMIAEAVWTTGEAVERLEQLNA